MLLHPNSPLFRWVGYTVYRIQVLPTHLGYLVMNVLVTSITEGDEKKRLWGLMQRINCFLFIIATVLEKSGKQVKKISRNFASSQEILNSILKVSLLVKIILFKKLPTKELISRASYLLALVLYYLSGVVTENSGN